MPIEKACRDSARRPDAVPPGELRRVEDVDSNGLKIVSWVGQRSFVHDFNRARWGARLVTSIRYLYVGLITATSIA